MWVKNCIKEHFLSLIGGDSYHNALLMIKGCYPQQRWSDCVCRIFLERRVKGFCIRGFEKDQIPGRHLGGVLADGVVDAVLFGVAFQTTDARFADFHTGHAPILPQQGADALLALGCLGLVQPIRRLYRPEDRPGRQFRGGDHQVEGFLFDFFLHCHHLQCSRVILAVTLCRGLGAGLFCRRFIGHRQYQQTVAQFQKGFRLME